MSLMCCAECDALVDTDAEPESFVEIGPWKHGYSNFICLCTECRELREMEEESRLQEMKEIYHDA